MSIKQKVYLAMAFLVVASIAAAIYTFVTIKSLDRADTALYQAATDAVGVSMFSTAQWKLRLELNQVVNNRTTVNPEPELVTRFNNAYAHFDTVLEAIRKNIDDPAIEKRSLDRHAKIRSSRDTLSQMLLVRKEGGFTPDDRVVVRNKMAELFDADFAGTENTVVEMVTASDKKLVVTTESFVTAANSAVAIFTVLILCFVSIAVGAKIMLLNKLETLSQAFSEVTSGDGDLTKSIPIHSHDELGDLAGYFNKFTDQVANIVRQVKKASEDTLYASTAMAATMEELSSTFQNQNVQVATVASAMEEMSSSALEISATLDDNNIYVNNAAKQSDEGAKELQSALASIHEISDKTDKLSATIENLS
ncbi:MAG: methyl-accepting chemotaxis protein, partial [Deferribacteraceae bacterium]|nr:methyl-accepting chemotaxis protein [Deferribacteraceae bacterium]